MAITRSSVADRSRTTAPPPRARVDARTPELLWLLIASAVVCAGLVLVYMGKTATEPRPDRAPLNLQTVDRREQLLPYLDMFQNPKDRAFAAGRVFDFLTDHRNSISNVGALARLRDRSGEAPLFTFQQLGRLKPRLIVRDLAAFRMRLVFWCVLFFAGFYAVHAFWVVTRFGGDWAFLPLLHLLTGIGLILMISLRDPLRDTLTFVSYGQGVLIGCIVLAALGRVDWERLAGGFSYVPLLGAILLSTLLILFGSGPGTSDAKVNLLGFQPVELIKILLVFFLAGYFARRWEFLRELREKSPSFANVTTHFNIPRLEYAAPVLAAIILVLAFFFLQRDMGPALVFACLFLILYAVARNRVALALTGILLIIGGFVGGYFLGHPHTVRERVQMWLSPWDNTVHGGDQVVQSLWAMSAGGAAGAGPGLGEPQFIPAGYTDLILAVLGEEWGFAGLLAVAVLYAVLLLLALRIARLAPTAYQFFLALGLTLLLALELLLISAGILDLVPLSGVVTPFLSYGRTAMIANFAIVGILLSISRGRTVSEETQPFESGLRWIQLGLAAVALVILGKTAYIQIVRADEVTGAGTLVVQADKVRRYQYNPRLMEIARRIPRGTIYDRHGIPLATSDWATLEQFRDQFMAMGIDIDKACDRNDSRHYPLGPSAFHLLGDLKTRLNWSASNSSLQERDSVVQLQGYDDRARVVEVKDTPAGKPAYTIKYDYRELLPLLRHRHEPDHPAVRRVLERDRDVHLSIDARLQVQLSRILHAQLRAARLDNGAIVVMDPANGDLLASVSEPVPAGVDPPEPALLDRARYGLYPPGSTFKVVTATAALRTNPELENQTFTCSRLPDGRTGAFIGNSKRPIRDDVQDTVPHGTINLDRAITVSCNAYFAQLAAYKLGAEPLLETAQQFGISVATPATAAQLRKALPQSAYGQGQVVASPFQMARVAATISNGGTMPFGRWVTDKTNTRVQEPKAVLAPNLAGILARDMRSVVTSGTGKRAAGSALPIAGKTGTAELANARSHAWFIGFAPYGQPVTQDSRRIAFAVLVENGQYGGTAAAPVGAEVVNAAQRLGLFQKGEAQ